MIWTSEEDLFQQLEAIPEQHSQNIDAKTRAIMAATIFNGLVHLIERTENRIKQSVEQTDKLIFELNATK